MSKGITSNSGPEAQVASASSITPGGGGEALRVSADYLFNSSDRRVVVNDHDLIRVVSIFNQTTNEQLYILGSETLTGIEFNSEVVFDYVNNNMTNNDKLYIVYQANVPNQIEFLLKKVLIELKENNKILKKIYK
jgi:hypothetical protein